MSGFADNVFVGMHHFHLHHYYVKFCGFLLRLYSNQQGSLEYFMKVDAWKAHHQKTLNLFGPSNYFSRFTIRQLQLVDCNEDFLLSLVSIWLYLSYLSCLSYEKNS